MLASVAKDAAGVEALAKERAISSHEK